jgi:peptidoglycan/xylan/chitin deacetylase (PgdA/CDA1 family)
MSRNTALFPALTFHDLDERPSVISFSPSLFRDGMASLSRAGYRKLAMQEVADVLVRDKAFPERSFGVTFDDGFRSVYEEAFPVLQTYSIPATVFLVVGKKRSRKLDSPLPSFQGRTMLSWKEIREMHRFGVNFGAHTLSHPDLTRLSSELVQEEVREGKAVIEDMLGAEVSWFAYPFGRYNQQTCRAVGSHFRYACSDKLGFIKKGSDLLALERIDAYYLRTGRLFNLMMTRHFPWYIRARKIPRKLRRLVSFK